MALSQKPGKKVSGICATGTCIAVCMMRFYGTLGFSSVQELLSWSVADRHTPCNHKMFQTVSDWFWWDRIWLPCNYTWDDLENSEGTGSVSQYQLFITLPLALFFMPLRYVFERVVAIPVARAMGIRSKVRLKASVNPVLEDFYISCSKRPSQAMHNEA
ncbi:ceramide synthase 3 isoform X1 [Pelobates cultripes]|uniref:Ceramide synthase 3 isoform X1 n=1 Tax=Pelobates cultripes TaxID=61616 RepID=A0AAD1VY42_PELCU|nr:ceramide synthase 3 isoform X1 [Pelobates cultripes]